MNNKPDTRKPFSLSYMSLSTLKTWVDRTLFGRYKLTSYLPDHIGANSPRGRQSLEEVLYARIENDKKYIYVVFLWTRLCKCSHSFIINFKSMAVSQGSHLTGLLVKSFKLQLPLLFPEINFTFT